MLSGSYGCYDTHQTASFANTIDCALFDDHEHHFYIAENVASESRVQTTIRSGTAAAANYGEARGAESRSYFIHKLRIVLKGINETTVWLQLVLENGLLSEKDIKPIVAENEELCRIIAASIKTAGGFDRG